MSKNIFIISTSLRKESNSQILALEFEKGAREAGHNVKSVSLSGKKIEFCRGCLSCTQTRKCIIKDDISSINDDMFKSDIIVFATPIYYYEMSGQMKTLLDRSNPLFNSQYTFRDIYLIATAAENRKEAISGAINGLQGWIECYEKTKLSGVIYGVGLTDESEAKNAKRLITESYNMGRSIK